ncbi:hypothetical protein [Streptomyces sp. S1]|uniref:hypothetical protein n=1 Tax=Streptomyces sp. S1 TaxID=718288 RepID=UPI000EF84C8D|nr:hypothetical protein [Streptomyces sp. S1]
MTDDLITIVRGRGGEVEAEGPMDSLASELLARAGFVKEYTLRGIGHRLPFDMGVEWENEHASRAAEMLRAARYPVRIDPALAPASVPSADGVDVPPSVAAAAQTLKARAAGGTDLQQPHEAGRALAALAQGEDSLLRPAADVLLAVATAVSSLPSPAHDRDARRLAELSGVLRVVETEVDRIALRLRAAPDVTSNAGRTKQAAVEVPAKLQSLIHRLGHARAREYEAHLPVPAAPGEPGRSR